MNAINFKRALGKELESIMKREKITKLEMAKRMHTSVTVVDRVLDPFHLLISLSAMENAFAVIGRQLEVKIS